MEIEIARFVMLFYCIFRISWSTSTLTHNNGLFNGIWHTTFDGSRCFCITSDATFLSVTTKTHNMTNFKSTFVKYWYWFGPYWVICVSLGKLACFNSNFIFFLSVFEPITWLSYQISVSFQLFFGIWNNELQFGFSMDIYFWMNWLDILNHHFRTWNHLLLPLALLFGSLWVHLSFDKHIFSQLHQQKSQRYPFVIPSSFPCLSYKIIALFRNKLHFVAQQELTYQFILVV